MSSNQTIWISWAQTLHRWGIAKATAAFLEAAGPMTIIAAQFFYICQPFVRTRLIDTDLEELGLLLENGQRTSEFIDLLKGDF